MHSDLAFDDADLNGLVDGRLDPARAAALSDSLASDPDVCARLDAWRRQNDSLRTMFSAVLFEPVPVRLLPLVMPPRDRAASLFTLKGFGARPSGVLATIAIGSALVGFALGALTSLGTDGFGLAQARGSAASLDAASARGTSHREPSMPTAPSSTTWFVPARRRRARRPSWRAGSSVAWARAFASPISPARAGPSSGPTSFRADTGRPPSCPTPRPPIASA